VTRPLAAAAGLALILACQPPETPPTGPYPVHRSITATEFWVGETTAMRIARTELNHTEHREHGELEISDSGSSVTSVSSMVTNPETQNPHSELSPGISHCFRGNQESAWDDRWQEHYGGYDDPDHRNGWYPAGFVPKENPFYFALPYNDFSGGVRRASASQVVYWAGEETWSDTESMCKNRWLRISLGNLSAYAQWEDVGPFLVNDSLYVFGGNRPRNPENDSTGLDVSPAVHDYLGLTGLDQVDWQFVPFDSVPDGPWKQVITVRQIYWERENRDCPGFVPRNQGLSQGFRAWAVPSLR
jgi:hypothetical protein